ncbi:MAG TPA: molybdate ABC transporter substrate-binding protein [Actinocrinis sp.]|nr:molybdate ABC transporter substrate-binding protein [Actinocrinis sp.]
MTFALPGRRARTACAFALAGAVALAAVAGCSSSSSSGAAAAAGSPSSGASSSTSPLTGTVTVFAAASLTGTFTQLGKDFQAAHPGVTVKFNFGGSDTLAASIVSGAPADVFAAASTTTMGTVTKAGDASGTPTVFVKNQLEIAVPPGDPKGIKTLSDLTKSGVKVALCATTVPCGAAAVKAEAAGNVKINPVTLETDVKSALTKVELGEVDAALVYQTDVKAAGGKVQGVDFAEAAKAVNTYPIVVLKEAPDATAAQAFVGFVLSSHSRDVLSAAGFQSP